MNAPPSEPGGSNGSGQPQQPSQPNICADIQQNSNNTNGEIHDYYGLSIGDTIKFGNYRGWYDLYWRVLDIKDGQALILCDTSFMNTAYSEEFFDITWENSCLRKYLNGGFLNGEYINRWNESEADLVTEFYYHFSENERKCIIKTLNHNLNNQWYGTEGGNDTEDYIFLLSIDQVIKYFGDSGQLANRPYDGNGNLTHSISDEFDYRRIFSSITDAFIDITYGTQWWLRSPGDSGRIATIHLLGQVVMYGTQPRDYTIDVRPALWLNISDYVNITPDETREHTR